ncbi:hypothetical protein Q8G36_21195 [Peribacillus frigoritolerans]|uniref:Uncharacterized protein n=1 Tax=Peribacillus frigoritolerans TaxID=450367 RepID=A0AA90PCR2_9BACI|nr:hypothetical protein [Peribacillus frigoritolerans]MDP1453484.1 hypothetical protein [Peribacillus frigoritolerans]
MLFAVVTTVWYLIGNPLGIDNSYVVAVTPLIVRLIDHSSGRMLVFCKTNRAA